MLLCWEKWKRGAVGGGGDPQKNTTKHESKRGTSGAIRNTWCSSTNSGSPPTTSNPGELKAWRQVSVRRCSVTSGDRLGPCTTLLPSPCSAKVALGSTSSLPKMNGVKCQMMPQSWWSFCCYADFFFCPDPLESHLLNSQARHRHHMGQFHFIQASADTRHASPPRGP